MAPSLVLLLALSTLAGSPSSAPPATSSSAEAARTTSAETNGAAGAAAPRTSGSLAAVGLSGVNLAPGEADFFNDYFSEQLASQGGLRIITRSEVQSVLGFERQKQLLGCSDADSQCLAEIAGALGVDGLIIGSVGRFGNGYGLNLKVVSALDARKWAGVSGQVKDQQAVLDFLEKSAIEVARATKRALGVVSVPGEGVAAGSTGAAASGTAATSAGESTGDPQWTRISEYNSFRVELLGLRYDRRLMDFLWLGVRSRMISGMNLATALPTFLADLALLARYEPMVVGPIGFGLQGGLAAAVQGWSVDPELYGRAGVAETMLQVMLGAELSLGRGWRFSLELAVPIRAGNDSFRGLGNQLYFTVGYAWFY